MWRGKSCIPPGSSTFLQRLLAASKKWQTRTANMESSASSALTSTPNDLATALKKRVEEAANLLRGFQASPY
jgi:hypothetical protein